MFCRFAVFEKGVCLLGFLLEQPPAAAAVSRELVLAIDLEVVPSFRAMVFAVSQPPVGLRCGAVLGAWELAAAVNIGWIGLDSISSRIAG